MCSIFTIYVFFVGAVPSANIKYGKYSLSDGHQPSFCSKEIFVVVLRVDVFVPDIQKCARLIFSVYLLCIDSTPTSMVVLCLNVFVLETFSSSVHTGN